VSDGNDSHSQTIAAAGLALAAGGAVWSTVPGVPPLLPALALAGALATIAVGLALLARRLRRLRSALELAQQTLAGLPPHGTWPVALPPPGSPPASSATEADPAATELLSLPPALAALLGGQPTTLLPAPTARALAEALAALRRDGTPFHLPLPAPGQRWFELHGRRLDARGDRPAHDLLWAGEITALWHERQQAQDEAAGTEARRLELQRTIDALPLPLWRRRADLTLAWCNRAFARALDRSPSVALEEGRELASGSAGQEQARALAERANRSGRAESELRRLVIDNRRHTLEVTETPVLIGGDAGVGIVGYALERTREEELRATLERHIAAHAAVLEQLGSAIAIFGPDRRLHFYNQAYLRLWGFEETWLATSPSYAEVLEELRARRRLQEQADFPRFKKQQLALFTTLIEAREDLMHLPDGTTLRSLVVPHPLGGLMFVLEDVTNTLALESSYNTLMAVQQETLDNLAEGVAVFGGDGRLKLTNPAYGRLWGLGARDLAGEPHVREILDRIRHCFSYGEDWESFRDAMVASTLERTGSHERLHRADGAVIECNTVPLPDGAVLITYLDVSDSVRVEKALRSATAALEAADQLKADLVANVSYHLRSPLNVILGFAELLAQQRAGPLNPRQREYLSSVQSAGRELLALLDQILEQSTRAFDVPPSRREPVALGSLLAAVAARVAEPPTRPLPGTGPWPPLRLQLAPADADALLEIDQRPLVRALVEVVGSVVNHGRRERSAPTAVILSALRQDDALVLTVATEPPEPLASPLDHTDPIALPLSVAQHLIALQGGRLEVDSPPGAPLGIRCILPLGPRQIPAAPGPVLAAAPAGRTAVAVISTADPAQGDVPLWLPPSAC